MLHFAILAHRNHCTTRPSQIACRSKCSSRGVAQKLANRTPCHCCVEGGWLAQPRTLLSNVILLGILTHASWVVEIKPTSNPRGSCRRSHSPRCPSSGRSKGLPRNHAFCVNQLKALQVPSPTIIRALNPPSAALRSTKNSIHSLLGSWSGSWFRALCVKGQGSGHSLRYRKLARINNTTHSNPKHSAS